MPENKFFQNSIDALNDLTRLDITTAVGNFSFFSKKKDDNGKDIPDKLNITDCQEKMSSQINLITGDITTAMTEKFVSDYKELREYHMVREAQGHDIIERNLEVLKKIAATISTIISDFNKTNPDQNADKKPDTV